MANKKNARSSSPLSKSGAGRNRPKIKARAGAGAKPAEKPREISVFDPDGVESVFDVMPDDDALQNAADLISGMAHPSRLKALIAVNVSELCVGDIAAVVGLSLSATSTMLKQLRSLGFLSTRSVGKQTYYSIASELPADVMGVVFAAQAAED